MPGNREPLVTSQQNSRCSRGQPCQFKTYFKTDSTPSLHNDGFSLNSRGLTMYSMYSDLNDLRHRAVRHVLDCTFTVTFPMEQRPSPSPPRPSYLQVARRPPIPRVLPSASSGTFERSVPPSCRHSRGTFQPPITSGGGRRNFQDHWGRPHPSGSSTAHQHVTGRGHAEHVAARLPAVRVPVPPAGRPTPPCPHFSTGVDRLPCAGKRHWVLKKGHDHVHAAPNVTVHSTNRTTNPKEME